MSMSLRSAVTLYKWFSKFISNHSDLKSQYPITKTKYIWHMLK